MVKYGSTLRIKLVDNFDKEYANYPFTVEEGWDKKIGGVASVLTKEIDKIVHDLTQVNQLPDAVLLRVLQDRGYRIETDELYYAESKSGTTKGHYLRKNRNGITCSCPGFMNHGYCWASTDLKNGKMLFISPWYSGEKNFNKYADAAL